MTADVVRFVDSIVASPTVRLDLNDEVKWWVKSFEANPPRLRRAMSSNAMSDGVFVSSSQYEARTLRIELDLRTSTQDANATEIQKLARELDRADNFLMYQPVGMTKPVFFKLFRSDMSQIEQLTGASAFRRPVIELLAEPFALGLRETLGPFTVNNDPSGSNGCYYDIGSVIGDVASPATVSITTAIAGWTGLLGISCEEPIWVSADGGTATAGTDTTLGNADVLYAGGDKAICTFATATAMTTRLSDWESALAPTPGRYRVVGRFGHSTTTGTFSVQLGQKTSASTYVYNAAASIVSADATARRKWVDLGIISSPHAAHIPKNRSDYPGISVEAPVFSLQAARVSGAGSLDIDGLLLIPVDVPEHPVASSLAFWAGGTPSAGGGSDVNFDASEASIITATAGTFSNMYTANTIVGSLPEVKPNLGALYSNVLSFMRTMAGDSLTTTTSVTVKYYPRYLFVRPSAT